MKPMLKMWSLAIAFNLVGYGLATGNRLTVTAILSATALGWLAYRIAWLTRDAGKFRVRTIPMVAPGGGA